MSELSNLFAELSVAAEEDRKKQEVLKRQVDALAETLGVPADIADPPQPEPEPEPEFEPEPELEPLPVVEEIEVITIPT